VPELQAGVRYVDTSALVKLVIREVESDALEQELRRWSDLATSAVTSIELPRAAARARCDSTAVVADEYTILGVLASLAEIPLSDEVRAAASSVTPVELRTLDAIHLASAVALGDDLAGVLTYDNRMQRAPVTATSRCSPPSPPQPEPTISQNRATDRSLGCSRPIRPRCHEQPCRTRPVAPSPGWSASREAGHLVVNS
jgi:predicted nucleic acid-binding protein